MQTFILFDDVPQKSAFLLQEFCYQDTLSPDNLAQLDDLLQQGWRRGLHCAVFADYEFGLFLQKLPARTDFSGSLKLFWFAQKQQIADAAAWLAQHQQPSPAGIATPQLNRSPEQYTHDIAHIHEAIRRGETYQINHTLRLHTESYGDPIRLYRRLRQNVPYAALAKLPDETWTLCFSPELFLRIQNNGLITTEPMKGTAPILHDGNDAQRAEQLRHDPKNRAENTMIVDLLRNDLGKLAQIGGVSVPEPFKIRAFGSVWQMTSVVQAQLKQGVGMADLFQAAFPCGSITGAPKRQSMQIIQSLEQNPRGLYTGSIGFLAPAPDGDLGFSGCLNVVIRTLTLTPKSNSSHEYSATYGVGSGIVIDSQAADEYAECAWKARFLTELRPEFDLFETMRVAGGEIALLPQHLDRLAKSASQLNIPFDRHRAETLVHESIQSLNHNEIQRFKLILHASGSLKTETAPLPALSSPQTVVSYPHALPRHDPLRRHKTSHRPTQDAACQFAQQHGAFDALLWNENGELLEGGRSSIMILLDNQWLTPARSLDILPSIAQQQALLSGSLKEAIITREMLARAEKIQLGNALRGWFEVRYLAI